MYADHVHIIETNSRPTLTFQAIDNKRITSRADAYSAPTGVGSGFYWREYDVEPVRAGLMLSHLNVETSNHSPSVTVSIFGALAEVLSHTEATNSNSVDQATTQSTTSTTTTTTTTTTPPPPPTTTEQVQDIVQASDPLFQSPLPTTHPVHYSQQRDSGFLPDPTAHTQSLRASSSKAGTTLVNTTEASYTSPDPSLADADQDIQISHTTSIGADNPLPTIEHATGKDLTAITSATANPTTTDTTYYNPHFGNLGRPRNDTAPDIDLSLDKDNMTHFISGNDTQVRSSLHGQRDNETAATVSGLEMFTTSSYSLTNETADTSTTERSNIALTENVPDPTAVSDLIISRSKEPVGNKTSGTNKTVGEDSDAAVQLTETNTQAKHTPTTPMSRVSHPKRAGDYVIYGILPNNTVVKKYPEPDHDDQGIVVYGILSNSTIVRKYSNGTVVPDARHSRVLITDIEPEALFNPNSHVYLRALDIPQNAESVTQMTMVFVLIQLPRFINPILYSL